MQIKTGVKILLDAGAEVDPLDSNHETALFLCTSRKSKKETVDLLLAAGADPCINKDRYNNTIPEYIKEIPTTERLEAFRQYFTPEDIGKIEEGIAEQNLLTERFIYQDWIYKYVIDVAKGLMIGQLSGKIEKLCSKRTIGYFL